MYIPTPGLLLMAGGITLGIAVLVQIILGFFTIGGAAIDSSNRKFYTIVGYILSLAMWIGIGLFAAGLITGVAALFN